ncbi:MAG: ribosomal-protein-alanine N-acetyltransferase [Anaerolinea sp.]|nr:ribosomal-protein-alanine N-acetyltransferase [Anaerolinea sp.]
MEITDLEEVSQLDQQSFSLPWPESSFIFEIEKNEVSRCWVAETRDERGDTHLVGMIVVWFIVDEVHIATLAVHPDMRKQKVAQRLLAHTLMDAFHSGAKKSFLEVRKGNLAARSLYHKFGFIYVGIRKAYYQNNGEDAVMMNLERFEIDKLESFL